MLSFLLSSLCLVALLLWILFPPEELEIEGNRPQAGLEGSQGTLCYLVASSLLFFVLLASFDTILV